MAVNISIQEVGGNVVWTSTGTLNITSLTFTGTIGAGAGFDATNSLFGSGLAGSADGYTGAISKPANFGTGGAGAASSSGNYLGVFGTPTTLYVPAGYTSGSAISNTTTYTGSFASLGLTPGTYTYSWGSGGNADSITLSIGVSATPTPTTTTTPTTTPTPTSTPAPAESTVQITSNNYNGQIADITFYPCSGGTISLGYQTIPYNYQTSYFYGQYSLFFSAYNSTCTYDIVCPSPTPTSTTTPTVTPTITPTPTQGGSGNFNVTVSQQGLDVLWSGSGSFNLDALTYTSTGTTGGGFNAGSAIWAIGPFVTIDIYSATSVTYPSSFGTGGVGVSSTAGSTVGILPGGSGRLLYLPTGYVSNTNITGSATYANNTIAGMGLSGGTYTWNYTTGGNSTSVVMTIIP